MYYLETGYDKHINFRNAVLMAIALHSAVIAGISFDFSSSPAYSPQIEVTLATRPSTRAPDEADMIAQSNQVGSGDEARINELTARATPPNPVGSDSMAAQQAGSRESTAGDSLTTTGISRRAAPDRSRQAEELEGISPEVDRLNREIANLQAELDEQSRAYAEQPRVRRITAASAKQSEDAAYLLDWRRRLEAVGNKYYPEASVRYGLYGDLRLLVAIRSDGSLEDIRVLSSSGYAVLDEAAIKIVRMAAPYSPFPEALKATTDKLEIIRTWHFRENQLSSK